MILVSSDNSFRTLVFCLQVHLCEGVRSPGAGVTHTCELPCGCGELNQGHLEGQPMLLTDEPSLQAPGSPLN